MDNNFEGTPSYWNSVLITGIIVGTISYLLPVIFGYVAINTEPSGSIFQLMIPALGVCFSCLIGAFGGMISVWHYAKTNEIVMKLGRGALIGFITGVAIAFFGLIVSQLWYFVDPDFAVKLQDSMVAIIEAIDMPEEQKQSQIDMMASQYAMNESFLGTILSFAGSAILYGILNCLTGMLGVKLFAEEETF